MHDYVRGPMPGTVEEYAQLISATSDTTERVRLIMQALETAHIFFYGLFLQLTEVEALRDDALFGWVPRLLEVICYGTVASLGSLHGDVLQHLTSPMHEKLRKLSVLSLCGPDVLAMSDIQHAVGDISTSEAEALLLDMISEGLISGRIDQRRGLFLLQDWAPRDVRPSDIGKMRETLEAFCSRCDAQLSLIQGMLQEFGN